MLSISNFAMHNNYPQQHTISHSNKQLQFRYRHSLEKMTSRNKFFFIDEQKKPRMAEEEETPVYVWVALGFLLFVFLLAIIFFLILIYKVYISTRIERIAYKQNSDRRSSQATGSWSRSVSSGTRDRLEKLADLGEGSAYGDEIVRTVENDYSFENPQKPRKVTYLRFH
jgi:hypothetical protein